MRIATIERIAKTIATTLTGGQAIEAATELLARLTSSIERSKALTDFSLKAGELEPLLDDVGAVNINLRFWKVISARYATEVTFSLTQGALHAFARTLYLSDGRGADSLLFVVADNGEYEEVKFYSVEGMAKLAVQRALEHRVSLMQNLGFTVSRPTLKKLVKSPGSNITF